MTNENVHPDKRTDTATQPASPTTDQFEQLALTLSDSIAELRIEIAELKQPQPSKIGQAIKREPVLTSQIIPAVTVDPLLFLGAVEAWERVGSGPMPSVLFGFVFAAVLIFHLLAAFIARSAVVPTESINQAAPHHHEKPSHRLSAVAHEGERVLGRDWHPRAP